MAKLLTGHEIHSLIPHTPRPGEMFTGPLTVVSMRVRSAQNFARPWRSNIVKLISYLIHTPAFPFTLAQLRVLQ